MSKKRTWTEVYAALNEEFGISGATVQRYRNDPAFPDREDYDAIRAWVAERYRPEHKPAKSSNATLARVEREEAEDSGAGIDLGDDYPECLTLRDAKLLVDIEAQKARVAQYQARLFEVQKGAYVEAVETVLREVHEGLYECELTPAQFGKLDRLFARALKKLATA